MVVPVGALGPAIDVRPLFPRERAALHELLGGLEPADWEREAVPGWTVGDVLAHVVHDHARRLSATRDGHRVALPPGATLPERLDRANGEFVRVARQLSPRVLRDLHTLLGEQLEAHWAEADLLGPADVDVPWAGAHPTPRWLDVAREYTEYWVHQQQVRDAVGHPGFDTPEVVAPVLDTFARALPHTLGALARPVGTRVRLEVTGPAGGRWDAVVAADGHWSLTAAGGVPGAHVVMDQDTFWRLACRGITEDEARSRSRALGDGELAAAVTTLLAVVR